MKLISTTDSKNAWSYIHSPYVFLVGAYLSIRVLFYLFFFYFYPIYIGKTVFCAFKSAAYTISK